MALSDQRAKHPVKRKRANKFFPHKATNFLKQTSFLIHSLTNLKTWHHETDTKWFLSVTGGTHPEEQGMCNGFVRSKGKASCQKKTRKQILPSQSHQFS